MEYFAKIAGTTHGPMTPSHLKDLASSGQLKTDDLVRRADSSTWHPAGNLKGLFDPPPQSARVSNTFQSPTPDRVVDCQKTEPSKENISSRQTRSRLQNGLLHFFFGFGTAAFIAGAVLSLRQINIASPREAYEQMVVDAENGRWTEVWNAIDKRSQGKLEVTLEMLASFASAFSDKQASELKGRELFIEMVSKRDDIKSQFVSRTVSSVTKGKGEANLEVWIADASGNREKQNVQMIYEDSRWKLTIDDTEPTQNKSIARASESDKKVEPHNTDVSAKSSSTSTSVPPPATTTETEVPRLEVVDADFRNTKWGMSRAQVKAQETTELTFEADAGIGYSGEVSGLSCLIAYIFVHDQLAMAKYVVDEEHSNKTDFISDYSKLKELLTSKYGDPGTNETIWKDDLYKDDPEDYGMAIAVGDLVMFSKWDLPATEIYLALLGENYDISLAIEYHSKELKQQKESFEKEKALSDL